MSQIMINILTHDNSLSQKTSQKTNRSGQRVVLKLWNLKCENVNFTSYVVTLKTCKELTNN